MSLLTERTIIFYHPHPCALARFPSIRPWICRLLDPPLILDVGTKYQVPLRRRYLWWTALFTPIWPSLYNKGRNLMFTTPECTPHPQLSDYRQLGSRGAYTAVLFCIILRETTRIPSPAPRRAHHTLEGVPSVHRELISNCVEKPSAAIDHGRNDASRPWRGGGPP